MTSLARAASPLAGAALLALALHAAAPAAAQTLGPGNIIQNPQANVPRREAGKPAALPGARGVALSAAPAERALSDLPPTEALFDAINRGDTAAARDAITRGARIDGRNILGLTPLELAIDLGRNELTFLLLSMRGAAAAPPPASSLPASPVPAAARPAPRPAERAAARPAPRPAPPRPARERQATAAAPVPQAGFLGFGPPTR